MSKKSKPNPKRQRRQPLRAAPGSMRAWICERRSRAVKTILILARDRKEAERKAANDDGEGVDVSYYDIGPTRVIREDKASNTKVSDGGPLIKPETVAGTRRSLD